MSNIGTRIRQAREALGWSQEELAHRMGYTSRAAINKVETGVNDVPQRKILKYAEVLGVSPTYLLGLVDEEGTKKNNAIAGVIVKLRSDEELCKAVQEFIELSETNAEDFVSVRRLIASLANK